MSRIGKKPILINEGIKVTKNEDTITVSGKMGTLSLKLNPLINCEILSNKVIFKRKSDSKNDKALHGLYAVLLKNLIKGVEQGYSKKLSLIGIGYRAEIKANNLILSIGYSHPIIFKAPTDVTIEVEKDNTIIVSGIDKQLVGQVAAKIRSLKPPEPYKGKGIKYEYEIIRRKAGKTSVKQ